MMRIISLIRPLEGGVQNQYLVYVDEVEFSTGDRWLMDDLEDLYKVCYLGVGSRKGYYFFKKEFNCTLFFKNKNQKIIFTNDNTRVLSIDNYKNKFFEDPVNNKLNNNSLETTGFYHSKFGEGLNKNQYLIKFSYLDLLQVIPYEFFKKNKYENYQNNQISLPYLSRVRLQSRLMLREPIIHSYKKNFRVYLPRCRVCGDEPSWENIIGRRSEFFGYRNSLVNGETRSLIGSLSGVSIGSGEFFIDAENASLITNYEPMKKRRIMLGDSLGDFTGRLDTTDFKKPFYMSVDSGEYQEFQLEIFVPSW